MATYSKGEITTQEIINAGKKLFYDKGYVATHCNDIAAEAGVNPGLIYYHFRTKGNIALTIYSEIFMNIQKINVSLFPDESLQIRTAIEVRIFWHLMTHSEEYKRFIYEITKERIPPEIAKGIGTKYFIGLSEANPAEQDETMLKLLCMCSVAIESEIVLGYAEGYFEFSEETMAIFDIKSMFELLSVPYDRINEILDQSKEFFSRLDIKLLPEFTIDISLKKSNVDL